MPIEILDFTDIVGQSLQIITSNQLLVTVEIFLAAILLQSEFVALHPERILKPEVEVVNVQSDIFGKVIDLVLQVVLARYIPSGIIRRDEIGVVAAKLLRVYAEC